MHKTLRVMWLPSVDRQTQRQWRFLCMFIIYRPLKYAYWGFCPSVSVIENVCVSELFKIACLLVK